LDRQRLVVITNGYEESTFRDAESIAPAPAPKGRRVLLHSGTIYATPDRDPTALFQALHALKVQGAVSAESFELRLRNPSSEEYFHELAAQTGVGDLVTVLPPLPYREALAEMITASGLLLLQGMTSNPAVPAKLYEYLRAGRPIVALVHANGETAHALRAAGIGVRASLSDVDSIVQLLLRWIRDPDFYAAATSDPASVARYSREALTSTLAALLDEVAPRALS
jgi:glycosyltransferase involved in cell wall biosynthesis